MSKSPISGIPATEKENISAYTSRKKLNLTIKESVEAREKARLTQVKERLESELSVMKAQVEDYARINEILKTDVINDDLYSELQKLLNSKNIETNETLKENLQSTENKKTAEKQLRASLKLPTLYANLTAKLGNFDDTKQKINQGSQNLFTDGLKSLSLTNLGAENAKKKVLAQAVEVLAQINQANQDLPKLERSPSVTKMSGIIGKAHEKLKTEKQQVIRVKDSDRYEYIANRIDKESGNLTATATTDFHSLDESTIQTNSLTTNVEAARQAKEESTAARDKIVPTELYNLDLALPGIIANNEKLSQNLKNSDEAAKALYNILENPETSSLSAEEIETLQEVKISLEESEKYNAESLNELYNFNFDGKLSLKDGMREQLFEQASQRAKSEDSQEVELEPLNENDQAALLKYFTAVKKAFITPNPQAQTNNLEKAVTTLKATNPNNLDWAICVKTKEESLKYLDTDQETGDSTLKLDEVESLRKSLAPKAPISTSVEKPLEALSDADQEILITYFKSVKSIPSQAPGAEIRFENAKNKLTKELKWAANIEIQDAKTYYSTDEETYEVSLNQEAVEELRKKPTIQSQSVTTTPSPAKTTTNGEYNSQTLMEDFIILMNREHKDETWEDRKNRGESLTDLTSEDRKAMKAILKKPKITELYKESLLYLSLEEGQRYEYASKTKEDLTIYKNFQESYLSACKYLITRGEATAEATQAVKNAEFESSIRNAWNERAKAKKFENNPPALTQEILGELMKYRKMLNSQTSTTTNIQLNKDLEIPNNNLAAAKRVLVYKTKNDKTQNVTIRNLIAEVIKEHDEISPDVLGNVETRIAVNSEIEARKKKFDLKSTTDTTAISAQISNDVFASNTKVTKDLSVESLAEITSKACSESLDKAPKLEETSPERSLGGFIKKFLDLKKTYEEQVQGKDQKPASDNSDDLDDLDGPNDYTPQEAHENFCANFDILVQEEADKSEFNPNGVDVESLRQSSIPNAVKNLTNDDITARLSLAKANPKTAIEGMDSNNLFPAGISDAHKRIILSSPTNKDFRENLSDSWRRAINASKITAVKNVVDNFTDGLEEYFNLSGDLNVTKDNREAFMNKLNERLSFLEDKDSLVSDLGCKKLQKFSKITKHYRKSFEEFTIKGGLNDTNFNERKRTCEKGFLYLVEQLEKSYYSIDSKDLAILKLKDVQDKKDPSKLSRLDVALRHSLLKNQESGNTITAQESEIEGKDIAAAKGHLTANLQTVKLLYNQPEAVKELFSGVTKAANKEFEMSIQEKLALCVTDPKYSKIRENVEAQKRSENRKYFDIKLTKLHPDYAEQSELLTRLNKSTQAIEKETAKLKSNSDRVLEAAKSQMEGSLDEDEAETAFKENRKNLMRYSYRGLSGKALPKEVRTLVRQASGGELFSSTSDSDLGKDNSALRGRVKALEQENETLKSEKISQQQEAEIKAEESRTRIKQLEEKLSASVPDFLKITQEELKALKEQARQSEKNLKEKNTSLTNAEKEKAAATLRVQELERSATEKDTINQAEKKELSDRIAATKAELEKLQDVTIEDKKTIEELKKELAESTDKSEENSDLTKEERESILKKKVRKMALVVEMAELKDKLEKSDAKDLGNEGYDDFLFDDGLGEDLKSARKNLEEKTNALTIITQERNDLLDLSNELLDSINQIEQEGKEVEDLEDELEEQKALVAKYEEILNARELTPEEHQIQKEEEAINQLLDNNPEFQNYVARNMEESLPEIENLFVKLRKIVSGKNNVQGDFSELKNDIYTNLFSGKLEIFSQDPLEEGTRDASNTRKLITHNDLTFGSDQVFLNANFGKITFDESGILKDEEGKNLVINDSEGKPMDLGIFNGVDFTKFSARGCEFTGVDFSKVKNLEKGRFSGCKFTDCIFPKGITAESDIFFKSKLELSDDFRKNFSAKIIEKDGVKTVEGDSLRGIVDRVEAKESQRPASPTGVDEVHEKEESTMVQLGTKTVATTLLKTPSNDPAPTNVFKLSGSQQAVAAVR